MPAPTLAVLQHVHHHHCTLQVKKWQALNNKRYAEKRKYGYTQVRTAQHDTTFRGSLQQRSQNGQK
jgi:hypothetical protein